MDQTLPKEAMQRLLNRPNVILPSTRPPASEREKNKIAYSRLKTMYKQQGKDAEWIEEHLATHAGNPDVIAAVDAALAEQAQANASQGSESAPVVNTPTPAPKPAPKHQAAAQAPKPKNPPQAPAPKPKVEDTKPKNEGKDEPQAPTLPPPGPALDKLPDALKQEQQAWADPHSTPEEG